MQFVIIVSLKNLLSTENTDFINSSLIIDICIYIMMQTFVTTYRASNITQDLKLLNLAQNYLSILSYADVFWKPQSIAFKFKNMTI